MDEGRLNEFSSDNPKDRISVLEATYQVKLAGVDYLGGQHIVPRIV